MVPQRSPPGEGLAFAPSMVIICLGVAERLRLCYIAGCHGQEEEMRAANSLQGGGRCTLVDFSRYG